MGCRLTPLSQVCWEEGLRFAGRDLGRSLAPRHCWGRMLLTLWMTSLGPSEALTSDTPPLLTLFSEANQGEEQTWALFFGRIWGVNI